MGTILRVVGYLIAIIMIISGIALFGVDELFFLGIVVIIIAIITIWAIRRSGQVSHKRETDSKADTTKKCPFCGGFGTIPSGIGPDGIGGIPRRTTCWKCNGKGNVKK